MGIFDYFRRTAASSVSAAVSASGENPPARQGAVRDFYGFKDPAFLEFIRAGSMYSSDALQNMAVLRCVSLISQSIGMLPTNLIETGAGKRVATEHPAYRLLKLKPNTWQTPMEFKSQLQLAVLRYGNGYARIVRSGGRPVALVPMDSLAVSPKLTDNWKMVYEYTRKNGGSVQLRAEDVFHLRDLSADGVEGLSRTKLAREAIDLAVEAQRAALRIFKTGVMAGGAIELPNELSEGAYERMHNSVNSGFGADNIGKWMLIEEGGKANKFANTALESQQAENRNIQIEEIGRAFGIPRPLMMMDDTSWGSGIEQLGIFFIQYGLQPWFTGWEQALSRSLLEEDELERYQFKFNERALLRGTLKDQADFFAKALGSGGHKPWQTQNEVRGLQDLPESEDSEANSLRNPMTQNGDTDEPETIA